MNIDDLIIAIEKRVERSDLATWHSSIDVGDGAIAVLYRKNGDPRLYGQVFDRRMFGLFEDETVASMAATIVAGEIEPPHDSGTVTTPGAVDASLLPDEAVHWVT